MDTGELGGESQGGDAEEMEMECAPVHASRKRSRSKRGDRAQQVLGEIPEPKRRSNEDRGRRSRAKRGSGGDYRKIVVTRMVWLGGLRAAVTAAEALTVASVQDRRIEPLQWVNPLGVRGQALRGSRAGSHARGVPMLARLIMLRRKCTRACRRPVERGVCDSVVGFRLCQWLHCIV